MSGSVANRMEALDWQKIALTALCAYLCGSVNFAVIFSKFKGKDVRTLGSGNAGSTNMLRNFGIKLALLTFVGDFLKGSAAVVLAGFINQGDIHVNIIQGVSAIFVLLGHMKPLYFGFKGGKGVATALGALLVLSPIPFVIIFVLGLTIAGVSGFVSLAAISMAVLYPVITYLFFFRSGNISFPFLLISVIIASMVLISHRGNIKRLLSGTENSIYKKRK